MKIHVETIECAGHGQCHLIDAELFPLDDDGFSALTSDVDVPAEQEAAARLGAGACPSRVISLLP